MYNLLVTYTAGAWSKGAYEYLTDRAILGYGDPAISDRYRGFSKEAVAELVTFPCLFLYEEGAAGRETGEFAHLGRITAIKPRGNKVRVEFELDSAFDPLPRPEIAKLMSRLDLNKFQMNHTHWAVKNVDLMVILSQAGLVKEKRIAAKGVHAKTSGDGGISKPVADLDIHPTVFRVPQQKVEPDLVSVMSPFAEAFNGVFDAIKAACGEHSFRCLRASDIWNEAEVIQDIFSLIYRSHVVVCDFSGRNPNVFYEAGIAHTLGKTVIPIVQDAEDIPFDLRHIRYVPYLNNNEGRMALRKDVSAKLAKIKASNASS